MPWNLWKKQVGTEFVFRKGVEFFSCLSFSPLIPQQKRAAAVHYVLCCYATIPRLFDVTKDSQDETPKSAILFFQVTI